MQGGGRGVGLADHHNVRLGLEQLADSPANDLVIIQQKDPDLRAVVHAS